MGLFWVIDYMILIPLCGCEIYACSHHLETMFVSVISPLSFKMGMCTLLKEENWTSSPWEMLVHTRVALEGQTDTDTLMG